MPNSVTTAGLEVKTYAEVVEDLNTALKAIYGEDIVLTSDTPDGQLVGNIAQLVVDNLDLLVEINNEFDPDLAVGRTLDQRVAINGIQRQAGTFTYQNITMTTDRALSLQGLDADVDDPDGTGYTIQDAAGTQWILVASQTVPSAGTYVYEFRAKNSGDVVSAPNTITIPVTIILGVTSVNNPTTYTTLGINEETDAELRLRRQKSVSLSSQGYLQGLLAALLNISGVTAAYVYENTTGSTDSDLIPSHSIWAIVQGGADADIGDAIYRKRNAGCGMKGDEEVVITQVDGTEFLVKFDRVESEDLYIEFDATSMNGVDTIDTDYIKDQLVLLLTPGVNEMVNINELGTIVQQIDSNCLVTGAGFGLSGGGPFTDTLEPSAKNKQFTLSAANISITVL